MNKATYKNTKVKSMVLYYKLCGVIYVILQMYYLAKKTRLSTNPHHQIYITINN